MNYKKSVLEKIKTFLKLVVNPLYSSQSIWYTRRLGHRLVHQGKLRKFESALLNLPDSMAATNYIHTCGVGFLYFTNSNDDLDVRSRTSFADWEPATRSKFAELSRENQLIIDIGAYSGVYSLIATKINPHARVLAFEPNPSTFEQLKTNASINFARNIELMNIGIGALPGKSRLFLSSSSSSSSSLIDNSSADSSIEIDVATLDSILGDTELEGKCLMKIDVEGLESAVLEGAKNFIEKHTPVIITEALDQEAVLEQELILNSLGYAKPMMISASHPTDKINYLWKTR